MYDSELLSATAHELPEFQAAALAIVCAEPDRLREALKHAEVAQQQSASDHGASLWHYISANAIEDALQLHPQSIYQRLVRAPKSERPELEGRLQETIEVLSSSDANVDAIADGYGGGAMQTPLNWLVSSGHPNVAGVMPQVVRGLLKAGAAINGLGNDSSPVTTALLFGMPSAVKQLFDAGAQIDNLLLAAAAGQTEQLEAQVGSKDFGDIARCTTTWFKPPELPKELLQWAIVFAAMCDRPDAIKLLAAENSSLVNCLPKISHMTATPLHTACIVGAQAAVTALVESGADPTIVEPRYSSDVMGWARHGGDLHVLQRVGQYAAEYQRKKLRTKEVEAFVAAVYSGDIAKLDAVFSADESSKVPPLSKLQLDGPWFHFDAPAVVQCKKDFKMVERLVSQGANINQKSLWWAGGFGILDEIDTKMAERYLERGAVLDVWSAAGLGRLEELREMISTAPELLAARGPDGKTPLHCAANCETAECLLDAGAPRDARCLDHASTALQYAVGKNNEVARLLVERGCEVDILAAATLGLRDVIARLLAEDPDSIMTCVDRKCFPSEAADSIYSWTIGWFATPHAAAKKAEQWDVLDYLFEVSPPQIALLNACLLGEPARIQQLKELGITGSRAPDQIAAFVAHSARNNNTSAVRELLDAGFDSLATSQHQATALHWSAFHGNVEMLMRLLDYPHDLSATDGDFACTALQWGRQGVCNGWFKDSGNYIESAKLLIEAGSPVGQEFKPTGESEFDALFV